MPVGTSGCAYRGGALQHRPGWARGPKRGGLVGQGIHSLAPLLGRAAHGAQACKGPAELRGPGGREQGPGPGIRRRCVALAALPAGGALWRPAPHTRRNVPAPAFGRAQSLRPQGAAPAAATSPRPRLRHIVCPYFSASSASASPPPPSASASPASPSAAASVSP